jgi:hypothetical protein
LTTKGLSAEQVQTINYRSSSAFALLWNMAKNRVPDEVIDDITDFCDRTGIYRMDANMRLPSAEGVYGVDIGDHAIQFHGVELAPPTGVMATNYARCVEFKFVCTIHLTFFQEYSL